MTIAGTQTLKMAQNNQVTNGNAFMHPQERWWVGQIWLSFPASTQSQLVAITNRKTFQ